MSTGKPDIANYKKVIPAIFILTLGIVCILLYRNSMSLMQNGSSFLSASDTLTANRLYQKGEKLKGSKPDSAIYYYKSAIQSLSTKKPNRDITHLTGLYHIALASLHCNLGKYDQSRLYVKIAKKNASLFNDTDIDGQADNITGLLYYNQSDYPKALKYYLLAEQKAIQAGNRKLRAKIATNRAIINYLQGNFNNAILDFRKTLFFAKQLNDKELLAGTYMNLGLIYSNAGDYNNGIINYDRALKMYQQMNGTDGILLCLQNMANIYLNQGNYSKTIETHLQALAKSIEIDDRASIAKEHNNLGEIYTRLGDYEKAVNEYLRSIKIKEELGDKEGISMSYTGLGNINFQQKDYKKALFYFNKSLIISQDLNLISGIASGYGNLANIYTALNNYSKAEAFYLKSIETYLKTDFKSGLSDSYLSLANLYRDKTKYRQAEELYNKCISIKESLGDQEGLSSVYFEKSMLYQAIAFTQNKPEQLSLALLHAKKSDKLAHIVGALPAIANATFALKKIYQTIGDTKNALFYANEYIEINDSLFNQRKTEALTFAEARWSSQKKQATINQLINQRKLDNEIIQRKNHESQLQRMIIWAIIFILVLTITVAIITILYLRKRKDIQIQLQRKELSNLRMQNARNTLSPHFLFNVLGSISGIVNQPDMVKRKINSLSYLLRQTLENIDNTTISIEDELQLVKNFIDLQWSRIPGKFNTTYQIDEKSDPKQLIPAMLIQIPVENAIKHGLMPLPDEDEKTLMIKIEDKENETIISVIDNGVGLYSSGHKTRGTGTGLKVLLQTIHHLNSANKNHILFELTENTTDTGEENGTKARISIPKQFNFNK